MIADRDNSSICRNVDVPMLSVIVPVHNDGRNLERCIHALRQNRFDRFEVVVLDDASTDDTPEVAEQLGARVIRLDRNVGPAAARNRGAREARGEFLLFIDADVCVGDETLRRVVETFEQHPEVDAVFGSYDDQPDHRGLYSQYRNLVHHFTHQTSRPEATTFWSGCGAIRRDVFIEHGGFNASYARPCIEDIEMGARLTDAGKRIRLDRGIQVTHLKRWTLWKMIKTDIFDRGIPWTRLTLAQGSIPNDLNLRISQRISALLALAFLAVQVVAAWYEPITLLFPVVGLLGVVVADFWRSKRVTRRPFRRLIELLVVGLLGVLAWFSGWWSLALAAPLVGIVALNLRFYLFFVRARSLTFTMFVLPLHVMYFLYSLLAFALGVTAHVLRRPTASAKPAAETVEPSPRG